jgi:hypothetical protein
MTDKKIRFPLLGMDLFLALTALYGAVFVVPTLPTSWLSFFPDYTLPALGLGTVGVVAGVAALAILGRPRLGAELSILAGLTIAAFEVVEATTAGNLLSPPPGTTAGGPLWLQPFYFLFGLVMAFLGLRLWAKVAPGETWTSRVSHPLAG